MSKVQIPQADEQQRLLANLIEQVNRDQMPLPRFWYFPRGEKAVVVMTGDDHARGGTTGQFDWDDLSQPAPAATSPTGSASAGRRTCTRTPTLRRRDARRRYEAQGFEIALHVNTDCANWTPASLADVLHARSSRSWRGQLPEPARAGHPPHPLHHLERLGDPAARSSSTNGIRLDTNYYYWPRRLGPEPARLLHRLRHADALRRPRRHR